MTANGSGPTPSADAGEARKDLLGSKITSETNGFAAANQAVIRADLIGSTQASAAGIVATGHAPVLKLCRRLIEAGHDPATPLEAYRGAMLCLRVHSIGEGARLTVKDGTDGKPRFAPYRELGIATAPPVAPNASEVANQPPEVTNALAEDASWKT